MRISVLIPTYRRHESLLRCLTGVASQRRLPDEVLVAYRDDDLETKQLFPRFASAPFNLRPIAVGDADASAARNQALAVSTGDLIAMLDDDAVPSAEWLLAIEAKFRTNPLLGGLGGPDWFGGVEIPVADRPETVGTVQWWGRRIGNHHRGARHPLQVEWLKGANMTFRRAALAPAPFGRALLGSGAQFAEDVAVSLQVKRMGWELLYDPAASVDHYPAAVMSERDHRTLSDRVSLREAAHNETVTLLDYLGGVRRGVFLVWSLLIGTRLLPGLVAAATLALQGQALPWHRFRVVAAGRLAGWRTWRRERVHDAAPIAVPPAWRETGGAEMRGNRICLVTHVVTPGDGQGRVNYELTRHLLRQGYRVTLVASEVAPELLGEPALTWVHVRVPRWAPDPVQWLCFAAGAWWKLGRAGAFDVVHLNGAIAPLPAHVNTSHFVHSAARRSLPFSPRLPLSGLYQRFIATASGYCERRAYPAAQQVVAVSEVVRDSLTVDVGIPSPRIEVIPVGVDSARFRPRRAGEPWSLRTELGLPEGSFLLLFVGDAKTPRKNLDLALRVLARLDSHFHLAVAGATGNGPYPAMARRLGVGEHAHFVGLRSDIAACYRDADAVLCPSHYEPASLVLLEAMACAVPVIATRAVGNAVFVTDKMNGFLLESSTDIDGAVRIIRRLAGDGGYGQQIGQAARDRVQGLTWEAMGERYEAVYSGLVAGTTSLGRNA